MRLFDKTSFYIRLIEDTVKCIGHFMIIMMIWYLTFGTAFYILALNQDDEDYMVISSGFWLVNALESAYLLGFGEFNLDAYDNPEQRYE